MSKKSPQSTRDTGIYQKTQRATFPSHDAKQFLQRWNDIKRHNYDLESILTAVESLLDAAHNLVVACDKDAPDNGVRQTWPKEAAPPEAVKDTEIDARAWLDSLRYQLQSGTPKEVACAAYWLGRFVERLNVRMVEDLARIGRDDQAKRRKGGQSRRSLKTPEDIRRCHELIDEYKGPRVSPTEVTRRVAAELSRELKRDISAKTVKRIWNKRDKA